LEQKPNQKTDGKRVPRNGKTEPKTEQKTSTKTEPIFEQNRMKNLRICMTTYRHDVYMLINVERTPDDGKLYVYQYVCSFFFPDEEIILSRYMYTYAAYYGYCSKKQPRTPTQQSKESKAGRAKNRELRFRERRREQLKLQQCIPEE
jgi:hypothetical protein